MIAFEIKIQARRNERKISRFFKYSLNRKLIALYLVIVSRKRGSGVEYCSLRDDLDFLFLLTVHYRSMCGVWSENSAVPS